MRKKTTFDGLIISKEYFIGFFNAIIAFGIIFLFYKILGPDSPNELTNPPSMIICFIKSFCLCILSILMWISISLTLSMEAAWANYVNIKSQSSKNNILLCLTFLIEIFSILPAFFIGLVLIRFCPYLLNIIDSHIIREVSKIILHWLLLCLTLAFADGNSSFLARHIRVEADEELSKQYIITMLMNGNRPGTILIEVFHNIVGKIFNAIRYRVPEFISGAIAVEFVFDIKGMGYFLISIINGDAGSISIIGKYIGAFLILWLIVDFLFLLLEKWYQQKYQRATL